MTTLTLDLPPDLYERLRQEAARQGKPERTVAQALLAERLMSHSDAGSEPPLAIQMAATIRALIAGKALGDFDQPPQGTPEDAIALLRSWAETDADDEGDEPWEAVLQAIDTHRSSDRKLFPELELQA
jgi:hypothetical protein